jgi:hypothetical protein
LVLETDELTSVVRPLRAAERMSRMRVRRELARVVGRASAIAALIWLRRPGRAQAMAAAAFTGALAAGVFSGAPAVSVSTAMPPTPVVAAPVVVRVAAVSRPVARVVRVAPVAMVVHRSAPAPRHRTPVQRVCAPASTPGDTPGQSADTDGGTTSIEGSAIGVVVETVNSQPIVKVKVPKAHTTDDGCVEVGA